MKIKLNCEDCNITINNMIKKEEKVNLILTSPPYNIGRSTKTDRAVKNRECAYDVYSDNMHDEDYCNFIKDLFIKFDKILYKNGVILWNVSYGNENYNSMWLSLCYILILTDFCIVDTICWKKKSAMPNNVSCNKLTRITEFIFVISRKKDFKTFQCNKKVKSVSRTGQKYYENIFNFIEAKNNDALCKLNQATFSSELVCKLLDIYAKNGDIVYDPFMGTGTTVIGCLKDKRISKVIGSEISEKQVIFSKKRILQFFKNNKRL